MPWNLLGAWASVCAEGGSQYWSVLRNGCIGEAVRVLFKVIERLNKKEKKKVLITEAIA